MIADGAGTTRGCTEVGLDDESFEMGGARRPACDGPAGDGIGVGEGRADERRPDVQGERRPDEPEGERGLLAYFPHSITVHPGDSVVFDWAGNGEPHTVTLGSLADSAVAAFNRLTPAQKQANTPPPGFAAIDATVPNLFPEGPGDATQSVSNPCFQHAGPVGSNICPNSQHEQPAFDGSFAYYNSGWLDSGRSGLHLSGTARDVPVHVRCTARRCRGRSPSSRRARRS
jgi:hypothetical protein